MKTKITRVTQSPMNPLRWFVDTVCGHGGWITAKRRPTAKMFNCRVCEKAQ